MPEGVWKFLHILFSVSFAASAIGSHWNAQLLRRASDWSARVALLEAIHRNGLMYGLGSLLALGVTGNLAAMAIGYRMSGGWMRSVNGLWLLLLLALIAVEIPAAARALAEARRGAEAGAAPAYASALGRWRVSNAVQLVLVLAFLALMVFRWTP